MNNLSVIKDEPFEPNFSNTFKFLYFDIILFLIYYTGLSIFIFESILNTYVSLGDIISKF